MVITSWSCWLKTQQARLNTLVNIEPAETLFDGQFSTSANTLLFPLLRPPAPAHFAVSDLKRLVSDLKQPRHLSL